MTLVHPLLVPVSVGISILAWGAVIQRARRLYHHPWSVGFWAYWAGFLALALMITLPLPAVQTLLDRRMGLTGLALFLQELAALAAC